jgi:acetyl-CoA acetyltransferase
VSSDVRVARCAGAIIDRGDGRLLRPSQDCAGIYGRALVFNEIRRLDDAGYEETPVMRIGADCASGLSGVHTYNRAGRWEVIDGRFLQKRSEL